MEAKHNIIRRPDWAERFTNFVTWSQLSIEDMDWNNINCGSWVGKAVEVMTDYDLYCDFRGYTSDATKAYKRLRELGFETLDDYVASQLPEIPIGMTRRGDLVLVPAEGDFCGIGMSHALAVAEPPHFLAMTNYGLGRGNLYEASRAFAVGER